MKNVTDKTLAVLRAIYKPDALFLQKALVQRARRYKFSFVFPEYELLTEKLEHVSGIQMHLALFQAFYATVFIAITEKHIGKDLPFNLNSAFSAAIIRQNVDFKKMLKPGEMAEIEVVLTMHGKITIGKTHPFFRINFNGFVTGEAEAVSPAA